MKVRGFNKTLKKWVYLIFEGENTFTGLEEWYDIVPRSRGHSTLQLDICGHEIFEDDIIKDSNGMLMKIIYGDYMEFSISEMAYIPSKGFYTKAPGLPQMPIEKLEGNVKVIGNTFDNTELNVIFETT